MLESLLLAYFFAGFWLAGGFCLQDNNKDLDNLQTILYTIFWVFLWFPSAIVFLWIYWKGKTQ